MANGGGASLARATGIITSLAVSQLVSCFFPVTKEDPRTKLRSREQNSTLCVFSWIVSLGKEICGRPGQSHSTLPKRY